MIIKNKYTFGINNMVYLNYDYKGNHYKKVKLMDLIYTTFLHKPKFQINIFHKLSKVIQIRS